MLFQLYDFVPQDIQIVVCLLLFFLSYIFLKLNDITFCLEKLLLEIGILFRDYLNPFLKGLVNSLLVFQLVLESEVLLLEMSHLAG
jgi:hypothetical protein